MGCSCNEPVTSLSGLPIDPSQHVNFTRGMVLGVDDFQQEFAYHDGHLHWLARDAIGYGTLSGLRVSIDDDGTLGPRLHVSAGSALVPSGQLVCVPADQCAVINSWLAKPANAAIVNRLLEPGSPPVSPPTDSAGTVALYLTLCISSCLTRPVPIPGEPCRSEDELMQPSRVADDFKLDLSDHRPLQDEEDALRDFGRWIADNVHPVDASPAPDDDEQAWLAVLRSAAQPWFAAQSASPPLSPPASFTSLGDWMFDVSPPGIDVAAHRRGAFLRVAQRFWVTELRPLWMAMRCAQAQQADADCVLLARLELDVIWVGGSPSGAWQVDSGADAVRVDESTRPVLASLRFLQEWADSLPDTALAAAADDLSSDADAGADSPAIDEAAVAAPLLVTRALPAAIESPEPVELPRPGATGVLRALTVTTSDLALGALHHVVVGRAQKAIELTLPPSLAASTGREYVVKNNGEATLSLRRAVRTKDRIDGEGAIDVEPGAAVTVVADGAAHWLVTAKA